MAAVSARILDINAGGSRLAWLCTAAFSWARRGPVAIPERHRDLYALLPDLPERVAQIEALAPGRLKVVPAKASFIPANCAWCKPDRPRITSIRVWGSPRRDRSLPTLSRVDTCLPCALGIPAMHGRGERIGAIRQALIEAPADAVIRVEVCE